MATGSRLDPVKLGIAGAVMWGLMIASTAVGAMYLSFGGNPWGLEFVKVMGSLYIGLEPTWKGALIGFLWGLMDGFLAGFLLAAFYNFLSRK